jgi:hypothetical protein
MYVIGTETGDFDVVFGEIIGIFCARLDGYASWRGETFRQLFNHGSITSRGPIFRFQGIRQS